MCVFEHNMKKIPWSLIFALFSRNYAYIFYIWKLFCAQIGEHHQQTYFSYSVLPYWILTQHQQSNIHIQMYYKLQQELFMLRWTIKIQLNSNFFNFHSDGSEKIKKNSGPTLCYLQHRSGWMKDERNNLRWINWWDDEVHKSDSLGRTRGSNESFSYIKRCRPKYFTFHAQISDFNLVCPEK